MPDNLWNIAVDGAAHAVSVEQDPATGRAAVRVDSRIAGRPMMPSDTEREFIIGTRGFAVLRTADGGFELEQGRIVSHDAPVVGGPRTPTYAGSVARPAVRSTGTGSGVNKNVLIIGAVVVLAIVIGIGALLPSVPYRLISWKPYESPDHRYHVLFPGDPKSEQSTVRFGPSDVQSVTLTATRRNHAYLVTYWDVPRLIRVDEAPHVLETSLNAMVSGMNMSIEKQESLTMAGRPAMRVTTHVPKTAESPEAFDEIALIADYNRIYLVQALRPVKDHYRGDLDKFIASFDIPK